jgi:hypothetical protein
MFPMVSKIVVRRLSISLQRFDNPKTDSERTGQWK